MDGIPGAAPEPGKPGFYADAGVEGDISLKMWVLHRALFHEIY